MAVGSSPTACNASDTFYLEIDVLGNGSKLKEHSFCFANENTIFLDATTVNAVYQWQDGSTKATYVAQSEGTYWVDVTLDAGCFRRDSFFVAFSGTDYEVALEITNVLCPGDTNGSILLEADIDISGFDIQWSNGSTSSDLFDLPAGEYTVTITDTINCDKVLTVLVTEPQPLAIEVVNLGHDINQQSNGFVEVDVTGGTPPYAYEWSLGGTPISEEQNINNLTTGTYSLLITDANECVILEDSIVVESIVPVGEIEEVPVVVIQPNPSGGAFWVRLDLNVPAEVHIEVFDLLGRRVAAVEKEEVVDKKSFAFDFLEIPAGVYPVKVTVANTVIVQPVVVTSGD